MKWSKWLENWDMTTLKIKAPFLEMEGTPKMKTKQLRGSYTLNYLQELLLSL